MLDIFNRPMHDFAKGYLPYVDLDPDPRAIRLETTEDVKALPVLDREYHVPDEGFFDSEDDIGRLFVRVRPSGGKSYYVRFHRPVHGGARTRFIAAISLITLHEARARASAMFKRALSEGAPKTMRRIPRHAPLEDAFTTYLDNHFDEQSDWKRTVTRLIGTHILPRFGARPASSLRRAHLIDLVDYIAMTHPGQANNLLKAARGFLRWCVAEGLLHANPLAGVPLPISRKARQGILSIDELATLYIASERVKEPWRTMFGLVMLTGEAIEDVRNIQGAHIDWPSREWIKFHRADQGPWGKADDLGVALNSAAIGLLESYRDKDGYLFESPRSAMFPRPLFWRADIMEVISKISQIARPCTIRDVRRAALHHIGSMSNDPHRSLESWGERLMQIVQLTRIRLRLAEIQGESEDVVL
jgi:hypothetical protein